MNSQFANQIRHTLGVADIGQMNTAFAELRALVSTPGLSGDAVLLLSGLEHFFQRIDVTYDQFDQEVEQRTRSLQLRSDELLRSSETIQQESIIQQTLIEQLRLGVNELLRSDNKAEIEDDTTGLSELVTTMAAMVHERSVVQHELQMQKNAMDEHAIISITDIDGKIIYANDRFCRISGFSNGELIGQGHQLINSNFHPEKFFKSLWQTILSGQVWRGEIRNRNKSGRLYWVSATIVPLLGADGRPERFIAMRTDITNRKLAEAAMEESRGFLQGITDTLDDGLFRLDEDMQCVFINPAAESQLGASLLTLLDEPFFDATGLCDSQNDRVDIHDLLVGIEEKKLLRSEDFFLTRRDGHIFPVSLVLAPLGSTDGADGWVGSFRDITERKRAQEELAAAKIEADRANHMKGQFLANMSHELRTPLNAVIGLGHLVQQSNLQPQQRNYLQKMESASQHLLGLINDILDYSKIEAGKMTIETIPLSLAETVRDIINLLQPKALQKQLALLFEVAPNVPDVIFGDRKRLGQVLLNLVDNALKFTERGQVSVSLSGSTMDDGRFYLEVGVRDQGIGLTPEQANKLFKPFVQADGSTARKFGGTGLGLAICRELVELMGGKIDVDSSPGVGSYFHFEIPCMPGVSRQTVDTAIGANSSAPVFLGYSALVVEGDPFNRLVETSLLESWGMRVEAAATGAEALGLLRAKRFDILLQDVKLPDMSGYDVMRCMREEFGLTEIPIIAFAGHVSDEERTACLDAGANDLISKPYDFDELANMVRRLLGISEAAFASDEDTAVTGTSSPLILADLQDLLARAEPLLSAFDPDVLDVAKAMDDACLHSEYAEVVRRFLNDLENFDFVQARKNFDALKIQLAATTAGVVHG